MATKDSSTAAQPWTAGSSFVLFALAVLVPISAYLISAVFRNPQVAWLASMFFLLAVLYVIGKQTVDRSLGVLIDGRNVMSLSRFQMTAWTVLILPAFLTAGMWNMAIGYIEPLAVELPTELWLLMGISTTSLVASPLILNGKKKTKVSLSEAKETAQSFVQAGDPPKTMRVRGAVVENTTPDQARFSDLLTGEEPGNAARADLARIQMFFFTLIVLATYAFALWKMLGALDGQGVEAFPGLDDSVLTLIGISHGGYLASKSVSHSSPPESDDDVAADRAGVVL